MTDSLDLALRSAVRICERQVLLSRWAGSIAIPAALAPGAESWLHRGWMRAHGVVVPGLATVSLAAGTLALALAFVIMGLGRRWALRGAVGALCGDEAVMREVVGALLSRASADDRRGRRSAHRVADALTQPGDSKTAHDVIESAVEQISTVLHEAPVDAHDVRDRVRHAANVRVEAARVRIARGLCVAFALALAGIAFGGVLAAVPR